jgi:hypothetical protein
MHSRPTNQLMGTVTFSLHLSELPGTLRAFVSSCIALLLVLVLVLLLLLLLLPPLLLLLQGAPLRAAGPAAAVPHQKLPPAVGQPVEWAAGHNMHT